MQHWLRCSALEAGGPVMGWSKDEAVCDSEQQTSGAGRLLYLHATERIGDWGLGGSRG